MYTDRIYHVYWSKIHIPSGKYPTDFYRIAAQKKNCEIAEYGFCLLELEKYLDANQVDISMNTGKIIIIRKDGLCLPRLQPRKSIGVMKRAVQSSTWRSSRSSSQTLTQRLSNQVSLAIVSLVLNLNACCVILSILFQCF